MTIIDINQILITVFLMYFILGYFSDILVFSKEKNGPVITDTDSTISSQLTRSSNR